MAALAANEVDIRLSGFSKLIFGQDITCKQARKFWEPSSPTTQCNGTIGPFNNGIECYICGMSIIRVVVRARSRSASLGSASVATATATDNNDSDSDSSNIDGRNPECEHILPIGLAVLYLGLHSPLFKTSGWYNKDIVKHEYAWAHRTCNQVKSDRSFIKMNPDHTQFILDIDKINIFLSDLWNIQRSDSAFFKFQLHDKYLNFDNFRSNRMNQDSLFIIKFNKILEILNSSKAPQLLLLAGVSCALNGDLKSKEGIVAIREKGDPVRLEQIRQETLRRQEEELKQRKEEIEKIYNTNRDIKSISHKDLVAKNKDYYVEIMLRLPYNDDYIKKWIKYIKNDIMIEVINNRINELPPNHRTLRSLVAQKIKLETENKKLYEIDNAATIITAESKLVKDAYKLLPPTPIVPRATAVPRVANNIIINNADRKAANILNSLDTLSNSLDQYNSNINILNGARVPNVIEARSILDKYIGNVGFIRGNNETRRRKALQYHINQRIAVNALHQLGTKRTRNNNRNVLNLNNLIKTFKKTYENNPRTGGKRNKTHKRLHKRN